MSSFILPIDHIGYLVNLGYQLEIHSVHNEHSNLTQRLSLDELCRYRHKSSYVDVVIMPRVSVEC